MKRITVYSKERGLRRLKEGVSLSEYRINYPDAIQVDMPSKDELEEMAMDCICEAIDGCGSIEPDGYCQHGYPSWLVALGYI